MASSLYAGSGWVLREVTKVNVKMRCKTEDVEAKAMTHCGDPDDTWPSTTDGALIARAYTSATQVVQPGTNKSSQNTTLSLGDQRDSLHRLTQSSRTAVE